LVLTGKKPNSADISDDISDVSSKTIIHCRLKIIGIYIPLITSAGLALRWKATFLSDCKRRHVTVTVSLPPARFF